MFISGSEIVKLGIVDTVDAEMIQPASIDLRLGDRIAVLTEDDEDIEFEEGPVFYEEKAFNGCIALNPMDFILAHTQETITIPDGYVAMVHGRSSTGRKGLFVQNAGWIDTGFSGQLTLELFNATNKTLYVPVGIRICQLTVAKVIGDTMGGYNGRYQGQTGPTPAYKEGKHELE